VGGAVRGAGQRGWRRDVEVPSSSDLLRLGDLSPSTAACAARTFRSAGGWARRSTVDAVGVSRTLSPS
jgi:hypothetical protein